MEKSNSQLFPQNWTIWQIFPWHCCLEVRVVWALRRRHGFSIPTVPARTCPLIYVDLWPRVQAWSECVPDLVCGWWDL